MRLAPEPGFSPHGSLIATGAVLFDRPDLAAKAGTVDSKTVTLLGVQCGAHASRSSSSAGAPASVRAMQFSESGYYLLGAGFDTPDEVRLLVDAGPLGYLSIAAHGHADALSFVLNIGDREILVDPGTYAYHTDPGMAALLPQHAARTTPWASTSRTSRCRPAISCGPTTRARAASSSNCGPASQRFVGEHDGYQRLEDPVVHRREIVFDPDQQVIEVADMLRCEGEHAARRAWHFAEDCQVERDGAGPAHRQRRSTQVHHGAARAPGARRDPSRRHARSRAAGFRAASAASSRRPRSLALA